MEGAGEGVVAILQGTKHEGLRVTLVPDNRLRTKRKCVLMDLGVRPPTRVTQSSVETNTERVFKNASEPMCDVRYATNFQYGNCKSVQSSFRVSEFPQHSTFYRHSDHFANSLRKYPIQASSEILQRIINYSNIKQNTRKQNVRSIRSLLRKSTSHQMNRRYENGVNTNNELYAKKPLNKSISMIGNRYSSQKELLNYTYDYLKCMSLIPRCTDVRYLTQVKKCIRNRLLEIIDDRPAICPRIRSRYSHHKRHFHGPIAKPTLSSNENEIQESCGTTKFAHMACMNPTYSRRKSCFCHQPKRCNCTSKLSKQNPLESLLKKLYPELNVNKPEIPSKQIVCDPKIQKPKDFNIKRSTADDKITTAVSDWLKSIPVYPNFSANDKIKQEALAFKLAENLSSIKNHVDFISKAKMEIMSCVNDLPMWCPPDPNEKEQFLDQIVAGLLKRLVNILENELKHKIAQAISNLSYTEDVDMEKIVDDFVYEIKTIVINPPDDEKDYMEVLKLKILDILNKLPIRCTMEKVEDVVDKLVKQLLEFRLNKSGDEELMTVGQNKIRENILKWCENVPELENINFSQNIDLIDELAHKFKYYESRGSNDEGLQSELVKTIRTWFEDAANTMNLSLSSKTKNRLSNRMANYFFGKDFNNTITKRKSSDINISEEALEPLLKWYYSIQELAGGKRVEILKALDRLSKELKDIQSRDSNFENMLTDMKEAVTVWLKNMLIKRGRHLESKDFDNLVNQLITELNNIPKRKKERSSGAYGQFHRDITTWMKSIPYFKPDSHLNQNKIIQKFCNKLNDIRKESDKGRIASKIFEAVTKFIQSLSESLEVQIKERDIKLLMEKLFERLMPSSKQRKRWDKVNDLSQSILTEFSDILQSYLNILGESKINNIRDQFYSKMTENVEEYGVPNWNYLQTQLSNIIHQETTFPKDECEDLADTIITGIQKMFLHEMTRQSATFSQPVKAYVEPARIIEHNSNVTKKHKTKKDSNDSGSDYAKNKSKKAHYRKINLQAGDGRKNRKNSKMSTIYKSSNSDLDVHDSVDYYNKHYDIGDNQNDNSDLNKLEDFRTSTPFSAPLKKFPTALNVKSPIGNITGDTENTLEHEFSKQPEYFMELKNVITDWIKSIDPRTHNIDLNNIVDGIASDIIDRQKYVQLSEAKYSESDEIEHLKYQIFRKLNKLMKNDILQQIMSKINSLYHCIRNINVPDLTKPENQSHIPTTSGHSNSIYDKISHWLDTVSSNLLKSSNIKQNPSLINKLVKNLENVEISNQADYEIEKDILLWLQNILRNCSAKIFHELREDLKSNLIDTAPKTSNILNQTSESLDQNISKAIVKWLQTAKFNKIRTSEERRLQEILALLLATNLANYLQVTKNEAENLNDLLIDEVQKYIKTIPMATEIRNDNFYHKAAGELVEYLKQTIPNIKEICDGIRNTSQTYHETTPTDLTDYRDLVQNIINNWCDNLPIHLGHSFESKEQAKKLKHNIAMELLEKIFNINLKDPNNDVDPEIVLSDEIDKIFNKVPMNRELEKSLPILKSILIEKLKQAKTQSQSLVPNKILHDTLTKALKEIENTPDLERASFNLLKEKLADAFINLYYNSSNDYEFRDILKDKLYYEINKFCNEYLERYPYSSLNSDDLRRNLYSTLKKVLIQDMHQFDISDESPKLSFDKGVMLKNATTQYTSPQLLPSTISIEDRAHLEEIRKRAAGYPEKVNTERPHKDLSSQFKETEVQTDCKKNVEENVQTSKTLLSDTMSYSKEIIPQVIIKEFYWDSNGSKENLQMFVPPALTPLKVVTQNKDTSNSKSQTEANIINNSTKLHISQELPDTRDIRNNKVDKASDAISPENNKKQEHLAHRYENAPGSPNYQTLISPQNSIHRQETEKPFHNFHRRRDARLYDNGNYDRHWYEQPCFDNDKYNRKESRQSNYFEDSIKIPDDRRILTQRIFLTPENRNKENMYCNHNTSWRMGAEACRRRCNSLKHCSRCGGGFCPHPSYAFFKKTF